TIRNILQYADPSIPQDLINAAIAEARFMRGVAYQFLVMNWGAVPIITDNVKSSEFPREIKRNTVESVWKFITHDLNYAMIHLPDSPAEPGRLTSWAAKGMLAKVYLTRAGVGASPNARHQMYLDSARILALDVIENSGARLMENYDDLFKTANNNNPETLFALQWTYDGSDWGSQNSVQAYLAFSSAITGFSDGWGGDLGASMYILNLYEGLVANGSTPDRRLKATFMLPGDHYPYIHQQVLDGDGNPRIEELIVPIGGSGYNNRAWVKKYVVGRPEDNGGRVAQQRTEIQTYMLRLADVYLILAEAILGNQSSTTDPQALTYFNRVRQRAGLQPKMQITFMDILEERMVEFAMEGQSWYDFVRLHYYNPELAYELLSTQNRGFVRITPTLYAQRQIDGETKEVAISWKVEDEPDYTGPKNYNVNSGNFRLPIPEIEISNYPNLKEEPVDYDFNQG
ncbi:MAG TPA: RagB/SusD family nutrient uptake outer membrane protein, partial [Membranihabitans sp.]|nr:RagB/SusD family nutrient uptake outer membrane protein [Membranihabitans sp.]